jgi:small ligand-binding sensory domain FIST
MSAFAYGHAAGPTWREHMFGSRGAELALIRRPPGDVPLVGFFCNGEISRDRWYGYTGVLTLFQ